ncbi:MAG: 50S ribosomal protein L17 [Opitutaceae bacterium]|nr:50S ribosomal protein L17 [Opitutaceae bacterium]
MRHSKQNHKLGIQTKHRLALLSNLGASLILKGRIETTLAKARALRPFIEKVITKAKKAAAIERKDGKLDPRALHLRRIALTDVRNEDAITLLFNEKAAQFANRPGGFTRIYKLGNRRLGDASEMALIELVAADDPGYKKTSRPRKAAKKKAAAPVAEAPAAEQPQA